MRLLKIFVVSVALQVIAGNVKKSNDDMNFACIVRFLQIKGKLEESFDSSPAPAEMCRILLPLVYANHSERLCLKLWETKSVKAECVFERLKNSEFLDLELQFEIYTKSKHLAKGEKKKRIYETKGRLREILISAAKICRSDATYGGLFDEILNINSSIIALQDSYCQLKYAIENKFLYVPNLNINPKNIPTSGIECVSIVTKHQVENEQKLLEAFHKRKYSSEAIECLLDLYSDDRIFGWSIAKDFLYKIKISEAVRRAEDWRISKALSDFNRKSANCLFSFNWSLF